MTNLALVWEWDHDLRTDQTASPLGSHLCFLLPVLAYEQLCSHFLDLEDWKDWSLLLVHHHLHHHHMRDLVILQMAWGLCHCPFDWCCCSRHQYFWLELMCHMIRGMDLSPLFLCKFREAFPQHSQLCKQIFREKKHAYTNSLFWVRFCRHFNMR